MKKIMFAILMIAALFLVGCGETGTTEPAPVEDEEVVFGFMGGLTGGVASLVVPIKESVSMAVDEVNEQNLIPGKKLRVIYEDDKCEAKDATNAMMKLVQQDKVRAVIGPACSPPVLAAGPIAEENGVLAVSYSATNPDIKNLGDYIFRVVPSDDGQGVEGAQIMKELGAKKVGVIYVNNDWGVGLKNVFVEAAGDMGLDVVAEEAYESDAGDFRAQLTKIKAAEPDVVYMLAFTSESGLILKQIQETGLDVQILGADASKGDEVIEVAGEAAEGLIVTLAAVPDSPELDAFAEKFKTTYGKEFSAYTGEAYDVVHILAKACAATDCSSSAMKDYLYDLEYVGASGTINFDELGEVSKPYDRFQVVEGEFVPYVAE